MKRAKSLSDWQQSRQESEEEEMASKMAEEDRRRQREKDMENWSYKVFDENWKLVDELKHEATAIRMAEEIHGKCIECIEGVGLRMLYPKQ
jgi:hypothetical protein